jgi:hypothetical protein
VCRTQACLMGFGVACLATVARAAEPPEAWNVATGFARAFGGAAASEHWTRPVSETCRDLWLEPPSFDLPLLLGDMADVSPTSPTDLADSASTVPTEVADAPSTGPSDVAANASGAEPFEKGTWAFHLSGSYYDSFDGDITLVYGSACVGYYFADGWAVDLRLSGYDLEQDGESRGVAGSFGVDLRSHFLVRDPFSLYLDGGLGIIRADSRFPNGGTNTNFTAQAGFGATYRLDDSVHLIGGVRWFHISNARRYGVDRNASTDGTAVYLGVMLTW